MSPRHLKRPEVRRALLLAGTVLWPLLSSAGDRLVATGAVSTIEGTAGGGLVPMAVLSSYATRNESGLAAFASFATTGDYDLSVAGVSYNWHNRLEVSLARQRLDLETLGPLLGMPDAVIRQNVVGAKLRLTGNLIYTRWPQISFGAQYKHNLDFTIPQVAGAEDDDGVDYYVSATKLYLAGLFDRNLLLNATLRATRANQTGLVGFGGDLNDDYELQLETSAGLFLNQHWIVGFEYRQKPDNLSFASEGDWKDLFVAWFPSKHVAVTGAWIDLGDVATLKNQSGWYLSLQASF